MKPAYLVARALWAPGYPNADAFRAGRHSPDAERPPCEIVPSRLRRWISLLSRMLVEVATQATRDAGFDPQQTATVFGSANGEIRIAVDQMRMMHEGDGKVSPAWFKNSVHNTAAGLLSIATGNRGFTTALAGGADTVATSLLEGLGLLADGFDEVVVAVADEPLPEPIARFGAYAPLGVAFALSATARPGACEIRIEDEGKPSPALQVPETFIDNPVAPALAILGAMETVSATRLPLDSGRPAGRALVIRPPGGQNRPQGDAPAAGSHEGTAT
jgi:hypothetical protein